MADSTIKGLTELETLKENDLLIAWKEGAPANQTKKITAVNARKFLIIEAVCDSAADATTKEVVIDANAIPERIAVTFTHGNTAGDTTQQGFTPLTLSIAYNGGSADFEICDSLGNYAGKGFGGGVDGGIIILQLLSTKALITNSDIRQKDANYTIKSDGYSNYYKKGDTITLGQAPYSGFVSANSASAYFFVPLPKKIKSTDTLTVTKCLGTVRSTLGYIDGTSGDIEYATSAYKIDVYYCYDNALQIRLQKQNIVPWSNVTNNTTICAWVALNISVT